MLRHHRRLSFAPTGACDFIVVLIFIVAYPLLWSSCSSSWDQTIIYCARLCVLSCGIIAGLNRRLVGRLAALMAGLNRRLIEHLAESQPSCSLLWQHCHSHTSVVLCCLLGSSMRPNLSCLRYHYCQLPPLSCRTNCGIIVNFNGRLTGQLAASSPTCG